MVSHQGWRNTTSHPMYGITTAVKHPVQC